MPQAPTRCGDQKQRRNGRKRLKYYQIRLENVIKKSQNDKHGFNLVCLLSKIDNFFYPITPEWVECKKVPKLYKKCQNIIQLPEIFF